MHNFSFIEFAILQMLEVGKLHGYAMTAKMRESSGGMLDLPAGSLYPSLHRLEESKLIMSRLMSVGGRNRRVYELTPAGLEFLVLQLRTWKTIVKTMGTLMGISQVPGS